MTGGPAMPSAVVLMKPAERGTNWKSALPMSTVIWRTFEFQLPNTWPEMMTIGLYRVVQLNFTPEIEIFYMPFERCPKVSIKSPWTVV